MDMSSAAFWALLNVSFSHQPQGVFFEQQSPEDYAALFAQEFPAARHPVLALNAPLFAYPASEADGLMQAYLLWNDRQQAAAAAFMTAHGLAPFSYVAGHIRAGMCLLASFVRACVCVCVVFV